MRFHGSQSINLVWDLASERLTVGGALVLRQEGEMLLQMQGCSGMTVHLVSPSPLRPRAKQLARLVFGSSWYPFQIVDAEKNAEGWPPETIRGKPGFSYYSFSRILELHAQTGRKPRLRWARKCEALALRARQQFTGRMYCIHLRSMAPFLPEESNADGQAWDSFFQRHAIPGQCDFVLIGDDPLPCGFELRPGVTRASDGALGLDLAAQLALIGISDGFLGMASGLCTAANFSKTPHVIFKHPEHHAIEMERELGSVQRFAFADECQHLWRCTANEASLDQALRTIS